DIKPLIKELITDGEREEEANDVAVGAAVQQDQAIVAAIFLYLADKGGIRFLGFRVAELDRHHGAQAADLDHVGALGLQGLKVLLQALTQDIAPFKQIFVLDNIDDSQGRGYRQGVTGIGAAQAAWARSIHDVGTAAGS